MSKHKNRGGGFAHGATVPNPQYHETPQGVDDAIIASSGLLITPGSMPQTLIATDAAIGMVQIPDAFHADEICFAPSNGFPSIIKLNGYLNEYRAAHHDAALLQMIPTAPNTYLFVWEL